MEDLDRKQKLHDAFLHNKVGPFFKSLTLFLAGIIALARCSAIFDQVLKDKSLELDFNMMRSVLDEIDEIDKQICVKIGNASTTAAGVQAVHVAKHRRGQRIETAVGSGS